MRMAYESEARERTLPKTVRQEDQSELGRDYVRIRQFSEQLCASQAGTWACKPAPT